MTGELQNPRIVRLTSLADALGLIDAVVRPVRPHERAIGAAVGGFLAEDVSSGGSLPAIAVALRDGWAVAADLTIDASAYAPAPLPGAVPIETGATLPAGTDAVAMIDSVIFRDDLAHALAAVAPGEGVLPVGGDAPFAGPILRRGCRLEQHHIAVLALAGIAQVSIRMPRIRIVSARTEPDPIIRQATAVIRATASRGGEISTSPDMALAPAMLGDGVDAIIVIGGTGSGSRDMTVGTLAAVGTVKVHGIAISPGETAAFGMVGDTPVLALPGRLDAAMAVFWLLGIPLLARLAATDQRLPGRMAKLTRKIVSAVGIAELIPVQCQDAAATPIASGYIPLAALVKANGWVFVPPECEGYPSDSEVMINPWP